MILLDPGDLLISILGWAVGEAEDTSDKACFPRPPTLPLLLVCLATEQQAVRDGFLEEMPKPCFLYPNSHEACLLAGSRQFQA